MRHLTLNETTIARYNTQHRQILNAIRTREPERVATLMKEHLETARLSLTRAAKLPVWTHMYNWHRPHGGIKQKTPISRLGSDQDNLLRLHI